MVSNCCLSLYLYIAGIRQGPGKMLLGSWKVLEIFVTKRVGMGTLHWPNTGQTVQLLDIDTLPFEKSLLFNKVK